MTSTRTAGQVGQHRTRPTPIDRLIFDLEAAAGDGALPPNGVATGSGLGGEPSGRGVYRVAEDQHPCDEGRRRAFDTATGLLRPARWNRLTAEQQWALGRAIAALARGATEDSLRARGARMLLRVLGLEQDAQARSRVARALVDGLGTHWTTAQFELDEIDAIADARTAWDAIAATDDLYKRCLRELRPAVLPEPATQGRRLVGVLMRHAHSKGWQGRPQEAAGLAVEAIESAHCVRTAVRYLHAIARE